MLTATTMDLRAIAHWACDHLDSLSHEHRVFRVASTLFDLTRDIHRLGPAARQVLRAAAIVHDVGRSVAKDDHPAIGARLILRDRRLPVSDADRRALAFLTRYHRDAVPDPGDEPILKDADERPSLRTILAILRAADALDSRSHESPRLAFVLTKKRVLKVTCYLEELSAKMRRLYQRRKKFRLLEQELGCTVEVDVRTADAFRRVA